MEDRDEETVKERKNRHFRDDLNPSEGINHRFSAILRGQNLAACHFRTLSEVGFASLDHG
jgi:hypothetical protein